MTTLNAIRTLTIRSKAEGVQETTAALKGLQAAHDGVAKSAQTTATVTDMASKRQLSVAAAYQRQTLALDEAARSQDRIARATRVADAAFQQGNITQVEHAKRLDLIRQRYATASVANDNFAKSTGLARHELINMSRQIQDVGVSLSSGQSPFTVLVQQGTQIGDIFSSSNGTLRGFGSQVASLITPARALGLGILAIGAATIAAAVSWRSFALQLDDTARQAGIASGEMAKLQAAASFKGIGTDEFSKAMGQFSQNVYEAKNNMGSLATVFRANGGIAKDFNSSLEKAADLIKNAGSDQQRLVLLQQMGLPATMEWVRLMSQGAEGIRKAKEEAVAFGGAANDNMVAKAREFDEAWNKLTTNFGLSWRKVIVDIASAFEWLSDKATAALMKIPGVGKNVPTNILKDAFNTGLGGTRLTQSQADQFYGAIGGSVSVRSNTSVSTVDPNALKQQLALEQQRIGVLGTMATVEQQVRSVEIGIQTARLDGVKITRDEERALLSLARAQAVGITQIRAQADAQKIEAATVFMSAEKAAAYRAVWEKVYEAQRQGRPLNEQQIGDLQKEADELAKLTSRTEQLKEMKSVFGDLAKSITQSMMAGKSFTDSMSTGLKAMSARLADKAIDNLLNGQFAQAAVGAVSAAISWLGSTFFGGKNEQVKEINAVNDRIAQYMSARAAAAQAMNPDDLATRLGQFEHEANVQRIAEERAGNEARAALDETLSVQRAQIIDEFNKSVIAKEQAAADERKRIADEIAHRQQSAQDRLLAATVDQTTLGGQLELFNRQAQREREAEAVAGGQAMVDLEAAQAAERFNLIKSFNDKIVDDAKRTAQEQLDAQTRAARAIVDYVNGLQTGPESALSPTQRLSAAQATYNSILPLAQAGNIDALGRITQDFENLRKAAQSFYGSSSGYQNILNSGINQLLALPAVATSTDPVVSAVRDVTAAVQASQAANTSVTTATTNAVQLDTTQTVNKFNEAIQKFADAVTYMSQTVNQLVTSNSLLDAIKNLNRTASDTLQLLNQQYSVPANVVPGQTASLPSSNLNSNMLGALNKIVFNTWATAANTKIISGWLNGNFIDKGGTYFGTYAAGGTVPPGGFGIFGEHHPDGPFFMRAGKNPVPITPSMPAANDNGADLRAIASRLDRLERTLARAILSGNSVAIERSKEENRELRRQTASLERSQRDAATRASIARKVA